MRRILILALVLLAAALPARGDEPADSIRAVIEAQLEALQANDLDGAFAHASPMIQSKFGTPDVFGRMVAAGYPMIWRPAEHRMLDLVETAGGPVQRVLFQDRQGRFHEAAYEMVLVGGIWRINGVYLRPVAGAGA